MKLPILLFLLLTTIASAQVYKTPSGEKYHLATCRSVKNVSQELSLSDAVESGLTPCKICKPPVSKSVRLVSAKKAKGESNTVRCKGMTKAGNRCKRMTGIGGGYCFQHGG